MATFNPERPLEGRGEPIGKLERLRDNLNFGKLFDSIFRGKKKGSDLPEDDGKSPTETFSLKGRGVDLSEFDDDDDEYEPNKEF